ncbi:MAG: TIGR01212 family radical SAM protein [Bacteroidetes bacterium]|nr:TIGR01212 family radical SAM protein [Bacteroidota bacterium]
MKRIFPWGDERRFNSYSRYFKRIFNERIQKVTIDAGFTCPNRDGTLGRGGCTYCNNDAFNPSYCKPERSIAWQIKEGIDFHAKRYPNSRKFLAYFQAFSNTYKPLEELKKIYEEALAVDGVIGLVIGTRPDCVDVEKLDYFEELSKRCYLVIEYGVESCYDSTLESINRGHNVEKAVWAIKETAKRGIHVGSHFILGLPGETKEMMLEQVDFINSLPINTVKFHQLQIFKDTIMAHDFEKHPEHFKFFEMEEYLEFFIKVLTHLRSDIVVERFAGEAPPRFQVNTGWGLIRNDELVMKLEKRLAELDLYQGCLYSE